MLLETLLKRIIFESLDAMSTTALAVEEESFSETLELVDEEEMYTRNHGARIRGRTMELLGLHDWAEFKGNFGSTSWDVSKSLRISGSNQRGRSVPILSSIYASEIRGAAMDSNNLTPRMIDEAVEKRTEQSMLDYLPSEDSWLTDPSLKKKGGKLTPLPKGLISSSSPTKGKHRMMMKQKHGRHGGSLISSYDYLPSTPSSTITSKERVKLWWQPSHDLGNLSVKPTEGLGLLAKLAASPSADFIPEAALERKVIVKRISPAGSPASRHDARLGGVPLESDLTMRASFHLGGEASADTEAASLTPVSKSKGLGSKNNTHVGSLTTATKMPLYTGHTWLNSYAAEKPAFKSSSFWGRMKLTEAMEVSSKEPQPNRVLCSVIAQLMVDLEQRMYGIAPLAIPVVGTLLKAVYLGNKSIEDFAFLGGHPQLVEDYDALGVIKSLVTSETYFEAVMYLNSELKEELMKRPDVDRENRLREARMKRNERMLERIATQWQHDKQRKIFLLWKNLASAEKQRIAHLSAILQRNSDKGILAWVLHAWKSTSGLIIAERNRLASNTTQAHLAALTAKLKEVRVANEKLENSIFHSQEKVHALEMKVQKLEAIMAMPSIHSPATSAATRAICNLILNCSEVVESTARHVLKDVTSERSTRNLVPQIPGSFLTVTDTLSGASKELETLTTWDKMDPFKTSAGKWLKEWASYLLRTAPPSERVIYTEVPHWDDMKDYYVAFTIYNAILRSYVAASFPHHISEISAKLDEAKLLLTRTPRKALEVVFDAARLLPSPYPIVTDFIKSPSAFVEEDLNATVTIGEHAFLASEGAAISATDPHRIIRRVAMYNGEAIKNTWLGPMLQFAFLTQLFTIHSALPGTNGGIHPPTSPPPPMLAREATMRVRLRGPSLRGSSLFDVTSKSGDTSDGTSTEEMEALVKSMVLRCNVIQATIKKYLGDTSKSAHLSDIPKNMNEDTISEFGKLIQLNVSLLPEMLTKLKANWIKIRRRRLEPIRLRQDLIHVAFNTMESTLLAERNVVEEDYDDGTFTTLDSRKLIDIWKVMKNYETGAMYAPEDIDSDMSLCKKIFRENLRAMKRIFTYYAASNDTGASGMSLDSVEFWRFVRDCQFCQDRKKMPSSKIDQIFNISLIDAATGERRRRESSDDGALLPLNFVECLMRIAFEKYPGKMPLHERLDTLMTKDILPRSCKTDTDLFRKKLSSDAMVAVFDKHVKKLRRIFNIYAAADEAGDAVLSLGTMNQKEFVKLFRDLDMIGPNLTERACVRVFCYVQQEEEELDASVDDEGGETEMVYSEFREAMAACAAILYPNPYVELENRVESYLLDTLFPAMNRVLQLQGKKL